MANAESGGVRFSDLRDLVKARMAAKDLEALGSVGWHVTTVKLNMEVDGEIRRLDGSGPQRLTLTQRGTS